MKTYVLNANIHINTIHNKQNEENPEDSSTDEWINKVQSTVLSMG